MQPRGAGRGLWWGPACGAGPWPPVGAGGGSRPSQFWCQQLPAPPSSFLGDASSPPRWVTGFRGRRVAQDKGLLTGHLSPASRRQGRPLGGQPRPVLAQAGASGPGEGAHSHRRAAVTQGRSLRAGGRPDGLGSEVSVCSPSRTSPGAPTGPREGLGGHRWCGLGRPRNAWPWGQGTGSAGKLGSPFGAGRAPEPGVLVLMGRLRQRRGLPGGATGHPRPLPRLPGCPRTGLGHLPPPPPPAPCRLDPTFHTRLSL